MNLWIKICGNTSMADARLSAEAGADAVGFVFAPSPRRVNPQQVAEIVPHLPPALEKIGVFVDTTLNEIVATIETTGLTGVQLHWNAPPDLPAKLRERFGPKLRVVRVVHFDEASFEHATAVAQDPHIDAILLDSCSATAVGGTGRTYDWALAGKKLFQDSEARKPIIAAGGLTPANVGEAVAALRPWGVDVVSGVELTPGRKDAAKVRAFIGNARAGENVTSRSR